MLAFEQNYKMEFIESRLGLRDIFPTAQEWAASFWPIVRGTVLGFMVGILPAAGATVAAFMSYGVEKQLSRHPEQFGNGAIEGVAGPESANNSATAGGHGPAPDPRHPGVGLHGGDARGLHDLGAPPGAAALCEEPRFRLGADREHVCRATSCF